MADTDADSEAAVRELTTEPKQVFARIQFRGGPGQEERAAQAWAFELTYYFLRGVGEPPRVSYADGIYACTGLMQTTHPWDRSDALIEFGYGEPPHIDHVLGLERQRSLRDLYSRRKFKFDGRSLCSLSGIITTPGRTAAGRSPPRRT